LVAITRKVIDCGYKLHVGLGPGLLESIYETVLARDLELRGLHVEKQKWVSFSYDGMEFNNVLRLDLLVDSQVLVEIKSLEKVLPVHPKQLLTYLRLLDLPVGLLLNFGAPTFKEGIQRVSNSNRRQ
jgi:iron complex transport system substrate-binding protein